ncbi:MAG: hypothetical protein ACKVZ6_22280 [Kineosporiaceae bacterium]
MAASQYQTNNEVDAMVAGGGVLYGGGMFTAVRAPRATASTARTYLAAFSTSTGAVTGFRVTLDGRVRALALSADNTTLYVGGDFTRVNGVARSRIAAVSTANGALRTAFAVGANSRVTALLRTSSTLYAAGDFTSIGGRNKVRLAALNATTGAVATGFTADLDGRPHTLAVDVSLRRLLVGGVFTSVNGAPHAAIASLDTTSGAAQPWAADGAGECVYGVRSIAVDEATDHAYVTTEADVPGCFEGSTRRTSPAGTSPGSTSAPAPAVRSSCSRVGSTSPPTPTTAVGWRAASPAAGSARTSSGSGSTRSTPRPAGSGTGSRTRTRAA